MHAEKRPSTPNRKICTCRRTASKLQRLETDGSCTMDMEIEELKNNPPMEPIVADSPAVTWPDRVSSLVGLPEHLRRRLVETVEDNWTWNCADKSDEVKLYGPNNKVALFHPGWSDGTAAVRGTKAINSGAGLCYWEVDLSHRVFGSALMLGVAGSATRLYKQQFVPLIGADEYSCGISHHGYAFRKGHSIQICDPFMEFCPAKVALLYDQKCGDLYYFKDDHILNHGDPVFTGLHRIPVPLYPILSSTASRSEMMLCTARTTFPTLQNICIQTLATSLKRAGMDPGQCNLTLPQTLLTQVRNCVVP